MRHLAFISFSAIALLAACLNVQAQDKPKAPEIDPAELDAAKATADALTHEERSLVNALRYLVRPSFEEELFAGRRYRPSPLPPFENASGEKFGDLDALRMWAVLESGMPLSGAADAHLRRMLDTQVPQSNNNLGPAALQMLVCRAAIARGDARNLELLKERAEKIWRWSLEQKAACSTGSPLVQRNYINPQWFANQYWRTQLMLCALEIGIKADSGLWENDLKALCKSFDRKGGFSSTTGVDDMAANLETNLLGMATLSLALTAPEKALSKATYSAVEKQLKAARSKTAEWGDEWHRLHARGAQLLLALNLHDELSPQRVSMDLWRRDVLSRALSTPDARGTISGRGTLLQAMGIAGGLTGRDAIDTAETALAAVALCGGKDPRPLAHHTAASLGRIMHALAVLHAGNERATGGNFQDRVNFAIEDGCRFIASRIVQDGTFDGIHQRQPGNTGVCLLALLHGGYARDHDVIKRGFDRLTKQCEELKGTGVGTYNAGLILMAYQKFYEPQMREAGLFSAKTAKEYDAARLQMRKLVARDHMAVIDAIIDQLDKSSGTQGGWGYYPAAARGNHADNSCTQFAVLAYQAGSTLGAKVGAQVFKSEAQRLIDSYAPAAGLNAVDFEYTATSLGRTAVIHKGKVVPGGWSYSIGKAGDSMQFTAAGIGSLAICLDELKSRDALDSKFEFEIARHIHGAQLRLSGTYYTEEQLSRAGYAIMNQGYDGHGTYYNLYSVERGCELADLRRIGNIDWYVVGAEALIEAQASDGSWGGGRLLGGRADLAKPSLINCAWAVLFLKRASPPVFTDHKRRDREKEAEPKEEPKPKSPITPGPDDKKKKEPERKVEGE